MLKQESKERHQFILDNLNPRGVGILSQFIVVDNLPHIFRQIIVFGNRSRHFSGFYISVESIAVFFKSGVNISVVGHFIINATLLSFTSVVFINSLTSLIVLSTKARSVLERKMFLPTVKQSATIFSQSEAQLCNKS